MAIRSAIKNPMIVVLMSGGSVDISWAKVRKYYHTMQSVLLLNSLSNVPTLLLSKSDHEVKHKT